MIAFATWIKLRVGGLRGFEMFHRFVLMNGKSGLGVSNSMEWIEESPARAELHKDQELLSACRSRWRI